MHLRRLAPVLLIVGALMCLTPWVSPSGALVLGIAIATTAGNPWPGAVSAWTRRVLAWSIVGLGAGMNLGRVLQAGAHGLGITFATITATLVLGTLLSRVLAVRGKAGLLVSVGTAICGGSAIAAMAPAVDAPEEEVGMALVTVFLLNAVALIVFPPLGHALGLGQKAFGLWSALAIHDTSSVVGAGLAYGPRALEVATTVKLARALWIVPVTLVAASLARRGNASRRYPWFILGFLAAAALCSWVPALHAAGQGVALLAHKGMALALYGIGAGISFSGLRRVGPRFLILGLLLWLVVSASSLALVRAGWLS